MQAWKYGPSMLKRSFLSFSLLCCEKELFRLFYLVMGGNGLYCLPVRQPLSACSELPALFSLDCLNDH